MIEDEKHALLFSVERSIRYHNHIRHFYNRLVLWGDIIFILLWLIAYGILIGFIPSTLLSIIVFVAIALSTFIFSLKTLAKSRVHLDLAVQFIQLEINMVKQSSFNKKHLDNWLALRLKIEQKEPPVLHVLNAICHNELIRAMDYDSLYLVKINSLQRWFSPLFDINKQSLKASY